MHSPAKSCIVLAAVLLAACSSNQPESTPRSGIHSLVIPLTTARPELPDRVCQQRLNGWVVLEITVNKDGTVKDSTVLESEPPEVFDAAAVNSVAHWTYEPRDSESKIRQKINLSYDECRADQLSGTR
jgi:TonB family protein